MNIHIKQHGDDVCTFRLYVNEEHLSTVDLTDLKLSEQVDFKALDYALVRFQIRKEEEALAMILDFLDEWAREAKASAEEVSWVEECPDDPSKKLYSAGIILEFAHKADAMRFKLQYAEELEVVR